MSILRDRVPVGGRKGWELVQDVVLPRTRVRICRVGYVRFEMDIWEGEVSVSDGKR